MTPRLPRIHETPPLGRAPAKPRANVLSGSNSPAVATRYRREHFFPRSGTALWVNRNAQADIPLHDHTFTELVLVVAGRGRHLTPGGEHPLMAGDVFVIHERERHGYGDTAGFEIVNVNFDVRLLGLPSHDLGAQSGYQALFTVEPALRRRHRLPPRLRLEPAELAHAAALTDRIQAELRSKQGGYRAVCASLFTELAVYLSRRYEQGPRRDPESILRLGKVLSLIEAQFADRLTLAALAKEAGLSQSTFQRAFRRAFGKAPIDYLIRYRVAKACELLRGGECLVVDAALRCGFEDGNYFTRQFRRVMGVPPKKWQAGHSTAG